MDAANDGASGAAAASERTQATTHA
jgi:hypothetical protein